MNGIGNALIDIIECEIGGDLIDRQYGLWHDVWNELSLSDEKREHMIQWLENREQVLLIQHLKIV